MIDQNARLTLSHEEMYLQPGEKKNMKLSLTSKVAGPVEGNIEIEPKSLGYSTLEFVANFCDYNRIISDS